VGFHAREGELKPSLIPINPEHLIQYDARMDNMRVVGEKPCCKYVRQIAYLQAPFLGIVYMNVNYCFVCGEKIVRRES
jgi:hypothetical protein